MEISYRNVLISAFETLESDMFEDLSRKNGRRTKHRRCIGDARLAELRVMLDCFGLERSKMQKVFHDSFLSCCAQHLYSQDPDVDMEDVCQRNNWEDTRQQVLCLTPRRFGKTTAVAMYIAAYALCVDRSVQSVFSTGRRASQKLLEQIRDMIRSTPFAEKIIKSNQECLIIQGDDPLDQRKIFSYPSNPKTLRGVGGDVIYLEEAAFLDIQVFYQVIVPLLEMDSTAMIAISTPQDSLNFYSEMFELKDHLGKPFFKQIKVSLICDMCRAAGKGEDCNHMSHWIPPWKSRDKFLMAKALYGSNTDLLKRESMGETTDDANSVFSSKDVNVLLESPRVKLDSSPDYVIIAADPNGGGSSQFAVVSIVLEGDRCVIVGLDSHHTTTHDEVESLMVQHMRSLRGVKELAYAWFIFIPENNLGIQADHLRHMVRNERRVFTVREKKKTGVCTTHERKEYYAETLLQFFTEKKLHLSSDLVCANPMLDANKRGVLTLAEFRKELIQFRRMVIPAARAFNLSKIVYTGKAKSGMRDDLVMTLMIALYFGKQFMKRQFPNVPYDQLV